MKTLFLTLLFFTAVLVSAVAQRGGSPEEKATAFTNEMKKELNLSDAQYDQALDINLAFANEAQGLRSMSRDERKPAFMRLRTQRNEQMREILDDEQFKGYVELEQERMERIESRL